MINSPSSLITIVENLPRSRVMLVGDLMVDEYIYGNAERLSPEAPVPVVQEKRRERRAGGAGNVAGDLAVLGAEVLCVSIRGDDKHGDMLVDMLRDMGVHTQGVMVQKDRPTTSKVRLVGLAQHRHPQQMLRLDCEDTSPISAEMTAQLLAYVRQNIAGCDVILFEDYNKGLMTPELCQSIIELARQYHKRVLVDPAPISNYGKYRGATTITPNRTEAEKATGLKLADNTNAAPELARALLDQLELETCVLTLDRHGMYLLEGDTSRGLLHATKPRNVYDVTGAGDMVLAMLAVALAGGANWSQAVDLANIAGGLEVERFGCVPIKREEIIAELCAEDRQEPSKIQNVKDLAAILERHRKAGKKIVFTNGCFDILHAGHTQYLSFSRKQGDLLVVGVNSDDSIRRLKGPSRPVNCQDDRMAVLAALWAVDYVVMFDDDTPHDLINALLPDVLIKGEDYAGKEVVGRDIVEARGGKVVLAPFLKGRSTSEIIKKSKG